MAGIGDTFEALRAAVGDHSSGQLIKGAAVGAVLKASEPDRFLLTLAYPAMKADVAVAADHRRDFATAPVVERACWKFMLNGAKVGIGHTDVLGTGDGGYDDSGTVVESTIYRNPIPWVMKAADGTEVEVRDGDWIVGIILTPKAWALYKSGQIGGVSPQGRATRRKPTREALAELRS